MARPDPIPFVPLERVRQLLAAVFVVAGLWYLAWRLGTFNPDAPLFSALIYGAEVFGFFSALLHIFMCWRSSDRRSAPPRAMRSVDVLVPSCNEPVDLVRKTLLAAIAMDGPHTTWLLDDARRPQMAALARELGCRYLSRPDNNDAKAGNLNHALAHCRGELVAIFDADHAPRRDFLERTLGCFDDERVGFVQTPQDFYDLDSYQHRWRSSRDTVWTEQALLFRVIQRGKDMWNAALFCGSCAVVRRSALDEIGGIATGTVTEDLHTSIRLHAHGWKSVYHAEPLAFGPAPESIEPFIGQRVRWSQGAMHVWRKEGILTHKGLTFAQRLNYLASVLACFDGWQKGIFYLAPVFALLTATMPLSAGTSEFVLHFVPYLVLTFWVFEEVGRGCGRSLFIEQYDMARFAAFAWATLAWIFPRSKSRPTSERMLAGSVLRFTAPQWAVMVLNLAAIPIGFALYRVGGELPTGGLIACSIWAAVNGAMALAVLTAASPRKTRSRCRFPVPLGAELVLADGSRVPGTIDDLSDSGMRFHGALPPGVAVGAPMTGTMLLPDATMAFWGEVRSIGDDGAAGCSFDTTDEGRQRLEAFLFGSDLQWQVSGLSDPVHTPLSRWLPRRVIGPQPHPLAGRRWNAAQLRFGPLAVPLHALHAAQGGGNGAIVTGDDEDAEASLLIAYSALPEGVTLRLDVFGRTRSASRWIRLERSMACSGELLHVYRVVEQPMPAWQRLPRHADDVVTQPAFLLARDAVSRARRGSGTPSTFDAEGGTL